MCIFPSHSVSYVVKLDFISAPLFHRVNLHKWNFYLIDLYSINCIAFVIGWLFFSSSSSPHWIYLLCFYFISFDFKNRLKYSMQNKFQCLEMFYFRNWKNRNQKPLILLQLTWNDLFNLITIQIQFIHKHSKLIGNRWFVYFIVLMRSQNQDSFECARGKSIKRKKSISSSDRESLFIQRFQEKFITI